MVQWSSSSSLSSDSNLWWDNTHSTLGIGTVSPSTSIQIGDVTKSYSVFVSGAPALFDMEVDNILVKNSEGNVVSIADELGGDIYKLNEDINTIKFEMATSIQIQHLKDAILSLARGLELLKFSNGASWCKEECEVLIRNCKEELEQI